MKKKYSLGFALILLSSSVSLKVFADAEVECIVSGTIDRQEYSPFCMAQLWPRGESSIIFRVSASKSIESVEWSLGRSSGGTWDCGSDRYCRYDQKSDIQRSIHAEACVKRIVYRDGSVDNFRFKCAEGEGVSFGGGPGIR